MSPEHSLKLDRWQSPPNINKLFLSFMVFFSCLGITFSQLKSSPKLHIAPLMLFTLITDGSLFLLCGSSHCYLYKKCMLGTLILSLL